jgi:predicted lipid carrier protein YhbT
MSLLEEQHQFYRDRVPAQFNASLTEQEARAQNDPEAKRLLEEMRAVRTSIRIEVMNDGDALIHLLEIESGVMRPVESVTRQPFFVLRHPIEEFPNLSRRCGASVLGFLGSMAGLGDDMKLTSQRVRSLRDLNGSLLFEVEGADGFSLLANFGVSAAAGDPSASIRLQPETFEALRSGELDAQDAFFDEKIDVEGDMEIAVGAALAALSAD